jgi:hypothetical protein
MYVLLRIQINDGKKEIEIGKSCIGESKFEILDWTSHLPDILDQGISSPSREP